MPAAAFDPGPVLNAISPFFAGGATPAAAFDPGPVLNASPPSYAGGAAPVAAFDPGPDLNASPPSYAVSAMAVPTVDPGLVQTAAPAGDNGAPQAPFDRAAAMVDNQAQSDGPLGTIGEAVEQTKDTLAGIAQDVKQLAQGAADQVKGAAQDVKDLFRDPEFSNDFWDGAHDTASKGASAAVDTARAAARDAKDLFSDQQFADDFWDGVHDTTGKIADALNRTVDAGVDKAKAAAADIKDLFNDSAFASDFWDGVRDAVDDPNKLAEAFKQGIPGGDRLAAAMSDPSRPVWDRLKDALIGASEWVMAADTVNAAGELGKAGGEKLIAKAFGDAAEEGEVASAVAETANVPVSPPKPDWVKSLPEGTPIDRNWLHETGYSAEQMDNIADIAASEDVLIGTRSTNMDSMHWVRDDLAELKDVNVKAKTAKGLSEVKNGLVDYETASQDAKDAMDGLMAKYPETYSVDDLGRFTKNGKPIAGDIDAVYIKSAKDGSYVDPETYDRIKQRLMTEANFQHGAEMYVERDLTVGQGLSAGTPEYEAAKEKAAHVLEMQDAAHASGKEIVIEIGPDRVVRRGPHLTRVPRPGDIDPPIRRLIK